MNASTERASASVAGPTADFGPGSVQPMPAGDDGDSAAAIPLDRPFNPVEWQESRAEQDSAGAGGRAVLGAALVAVALAWLGYIAWLVGRTLPGAEPASPEIAQWIATAAAPLALLGLGWMMFGRTRRREAEHFTRSVVAMRTEARSLEALLDVLAQRIDDNHLALAQTAEQLMRLGDEAASRLGVVKQDLERGSEALAAHSTTLDRTAESARNDIAALLEDMPRATSGAAALGEQLRLLGQRSRDDVRALEQQLTELGASSEAVDTVLNESAVRLAERAREIERAGEVAGTAILAASEAGNARVDELLDHCATTLGEIRSGIDGQAAAVAALVEQARAGLAHAGIEAADALGGRLEAATGALDRLGLTLAEQDRAAQRLLAETDSAAQALDLRFARLAEDGEVRTEALTKALGRLRDELAGLTAGASGNDAAILSLAERAGALRGQVEACASEVRDGLVQALGEAEDGAARLSLATQTARPEVEWLRDAAREAATRIGENSAVIDLQQDQLAALLGSLDEGTIMSQAQLSDLSQAISTAEADAARLNGETAPALVAALVQVREAAAHAADRAREAIREVIPQGARQLSLATRDALEAAIRDGIEQQLGQVAEVAGRAVEAARSASDRLSRQMLNIGQSAAALEAHIERTQADTRQADSEAFTRRVSLLIDSMHSASIDVGKILADEIDDKAWSNYLRGDRAVFTRRAARLIGGGEATAIRVHYDADTEFQRSVNRYVHDFEAMLRRVLAEQDGPMIAVTLLSSDMGKLYAALGQAIDKRRKWSPAASG